MDIAPLDPERGADTALAAQLAALINDVYAVAERGLWLPEATRTTPTEVAELITAGQIAVATRHEHIIGCIRLHDASEDTSEFGLLVADPAHRNLGVGRALLDFAERASRERGLRAMQLELLVPRDWVHPDKEFLKAWYGRRGYRLVRVGRIDDAYPHLAPLLATACDLEIHAKPLRARAAAQRLRMGA